jgi:DNA-binding MarR family transcriptional regulator
MAAIVEVEPITIARLVDRLEARGLVVRKADPRDRRVWRLHLTPAAAPILREIAKYRGEIHEVITAGMTPSLQKAITDGLLQMKANLAAEVRATGKAGSAATPMPGHNGGAARRERHA